MVTRHGMATALVGAGSLAAVGIAIHTALNLRHLRRPVPRPPMPEDDKDDRGSAAQDRRDPRRERVSVLIPARNEAATIATAVTSAAAQHTDAGSVPLELEIVVLDDGSQDDTAAIVAALAATDPRITLIRGADEAPPAGWLGKPWACARLSDEATGSVLAFIDADVELDPDAASALVDTLRAEGFTMLAPYPHQEARGWLERLVQPLVTWSWAATLPLGWAENSTRPSLSAANGQLLVMDAAAYRSIGGHAAVAGEVLEDIALMRAFKRRGLRTATVDGSHLARCRMYCGSREVVDGYGKSLWDAFNGPVGSLGVNALLVGAFVVPALGAVGSRSTRVRALGVVGYAAGVTSRALVARRTGERVLPDALAQPLSIIAFVTLNVISWQRHLRGANTWKGRSVIASGSGA